MTGLKILGTGSFVPGFRMTNQLLETIVETDDEWIKTRTGISERRIASPEETSLSMSLSAAKKALESARRAGREINIGVIVCATITGDFLTPSLSCLLQKELGLAQDIAALDINCACSGYVMAIKTAHALLESMPGRCALVIGCEMLSRITDYTDRTTCVLFGDAAGAAVIARDDGEDGSARAFAFDCGARGNSEHLFCKAQYIGNNPLMPRVSEQAPDALHMNGQEVFRFAVEVCAKSVSNVLAQSGLSVKDTAKFIFHQANRRIIDAVAKKLSIPPEKCFVNIEKYGNTSSATCAVALDELMRSGEVAPGDKIVVAAFGGGLTHAGMLLTL